MHKHNTNKSYALPKSIHSPSVINNPHKPQQGLSNMDFLLYCYEHNLFFRSKKAFEKHKLECLRLLRKKNVCTILLSNGNMCGKDFKHVSTLQNHCISAHKLFICVHCDIVCRNVEELDNHTHVGPWDVHESKYHQTIIIMLSAINDHLNNVDI